MNAAESCHLPVFSMILPFVFRFVTRTCKSDYHYGSLKIPQGLTVLVPTYQLHHDPRHWPDPERFDPER